MRVVVIGIGNPFRRDDGAGLRAAALARAALPPGVACVESDGESSRLLDAWDGADTAILIDAVRSGAPPGTVVRSEPGHRPLPDSSAGRSTHDLGVGAAVALGRALSRIPARVVVYGIETERDDFGPGLTSAVARGASVAAERVVAEATTLAAAPTPVGAQRARAPRRHGRAPEDRGTAPCA